MLNVKAFVFDVDGVMTDGSLLCTEEGELLRTMNAKDGYAIQTLLKARMHVAIITGGDSIGVFKRLEKLGIAHIYDKSRNKEEILQKHLQTIKIEAKDVLYMGDDVPDLAVMQMCGVRCCPADAVDEIKNICHYVAKKGGGQACVREVVEMVLKLQSKWEV